MEIVKKKIIATLCLITILLANISVYAAEVTLYALDGRTLLVDESQVEIYTAEGMGWFKDKPVTMYAADGRTIVVPADRVEAHKAVGWFVKEGVETPTLPPERPTLPENSDNSGNNDNSEELAVIRYTDGTLVRVPLKDVAAHKALGWEHIYVEFNKMGNVIVYNSEGDPREITFDNAEKYAKEGWYFIKPGTQPAPLPEIEVEVKDENITVYRHTGTTKVILSSELSAYKSKGYGTTLDEAIYNFATLGDGGDNTGSNALLENKKYELAFREIESALNKIGDSNSEYVQMLYTQRTKIVEAWEAAAKSPLGFINYWFDTRNGKRVILFEYRNVGNKRITYLSINFDICDSTGEVIESNDGTYFVNNLQIVPCDKTRVGWVIQSGEEAASIKNVKVLEVRFSDGTVWKAGQ